MAPFIKVFVAPPKTVFPRTSDIKQIHFKFRPTILYQAQMCYYVAVLVYFIYFLKVSKCF